jgi:arylsulfatase A-like enzyme
LTIDYERNKSAIEMPKFLTSVKNHLLTGAVFTAISLVYLNVVTVAKFYIAGGDFTRQPATDKLYAIFQIVKGNSWPFALFGLLITLFLLIVFHRFYSFRSRVASCHLALFLILGLIIQTHQLAHSGLFPQTKSLGFYVAALILALVAFAVYHLSSRAAFLILEKTKAGLKLYLLGITIAVIALVLLFKGQFGHATASGGEGYNVLLLTVDTLRKDHLSYDGYFRPTSPFLDKFSREGVSFENAYSATSHTLPSLGSILTAKYPMHHGVRNNSAYALADTNLTIAEVFKRHGYVTGAVVENGALRPSRNYDQGFDYYGEAYYISSVKYDIPGLIVLNRISKFFGEKLFISPGGEAYHGTNMAIRFLKKNKDKKFFCWVHYIDPHLPYAPPRGYDNRFCKRQRRFAAENFTIGKDLRKYELNLPPSPGVVEKINALYDGDVLYTDRQIGRLLEALEKMNLTSKTLIIFSSDHGESLGDHYYYVGHGRLVYNANIAVPLVIRFPDLRHKGIIKEPVSNVNIMPTILDFLGWNQEVFPGVIDGVSLMPLIREGKREHLPLVRSQSGVPWSFDPKLFDQMETGGVNPLKTVAAKLAVDTRFGMEASLREQIELKLRTVIKGNWKLIYVPVKDSTSPTGQRHYYELYDISSDWGEKYDLFASQPEVFRELKSEIESWCAADTGSCIFAETIEMDKEDLEALKALGYIQ